MSGTSTPTPASIALLPLLQIPLKKTHQVDFKDAFVAYISASSGLHQGGASSSGDNFTQEIYTLNKYRQDMTGGLDMTGRNILVRYYGQLERLDARFPIHENGVKILFTWADAFHPEEDVSQFSIAFEKANVLFNLAANCSAISAHQNRHEEEGCRRSFHHLQCAAGILIFMADNFLHAPLTDMCRDSLVCLSDLMLAQAQETFVEKCLGERKQGNLVAKLTAHLVVLYDKVYDSCQTSVLANEYPKAWSEYVKCKSRYFNAMSHYHKSIQCLDAGEYGNRIAYLTASDGFIKEASKIASAGSKAFSYFSASSSSSKTDSKSNSFNALMDTCKNMATLISDAKLGAIKDNDLIYHMPVPGPEALNIDKTPIAKTLGFSDIFKTKEELASVVGPDLFARLIPEIVVENSSIYSEQKATLVRTISSRVQDGIDDVRVRLKSLDLPDIYKVARCGATGASLLSSGAEFEDLCERTKYCTLNQSDINRFRTCKSDVHNRLAAMKRDLDSEDVELNALKVKYGDRWTLTQPPIFAQFRQDLKGLSDSLANAHVSDAVTEHLLSTMSPVHALMAADDKSGIKRELTKLLSEGGEGMITQNLLDSSISDEANAIQSIQSAVDRLHAAEKELLKCLDGLKELVQKDDISEHLIGVKGAQAVEAVRTRELEKFTPYVRALEEGVVKLGGQFMTIEQMVGGLVGSTSFQSKTSQTKAQVGRIIEWSGVLDECNGLGGQLAKALGFYEACAKSCGDLSFYVADFLGKRVTEKRVAESRLVGATSSMPVAYHPPMPQPSSRLAPSDYALPYPSASYASSSSPPGLVHQPPFKPSNYCTEQGFPPPGHLPSGTASPGYFSTHQSGRS